METFATLLNRKVLILSQRTNYVGVEKYFLSALFAERLKSVQVDELWYLRRYPDVVSALQSGVCTSAGDHYARHGFFEHRLPRHFPFDEDWYLEQHEDVRRAVRGKDFPSGRQHFEEVGFREGRSPYDGFSLDVVA